MTGTTDSYDKCALCNRDFKDHDVWQLRICLRDVSDKIWAMRKRISNPEIQRLIDKYTTGDKR